MVPVHMYVLNSLLSDKAGGEDEGYFSITVREVVRGEVVGYEEGKLCLLARCPLWTI